MSVISLISFPFLARSSLTYWFLRFWINSRTVVIALSRVFVLFMGFRYLLVFVFFSVFDLLRFWVWVWDWVVERSWVVLVWRNKGTSEVFEYFECLEAWWSGDGFWGRRIAGMFDGYECTER